MQGRLELGGARRHFASGTYVRICMHAHTHTHTRCGHTVGHAHALSDYLVFRASWSLGVRADAPLCTHVAPGRRLTLTPTHCAPCALSQPGLQVMAPLKKHIVVANSHALRSV